MPRIISGKAKGMTLKSLEGDQTRPTGDRLKESLFSILMPRLPGCCFLDLFAGTGQIGLEAASRGAASVILCEKNRRAAAIISENINRTGLSEVCQLEIMSALQLVRRLREKQWTGDLVYFDPPWREEETLLSQLAPDLFSILKDNGNLIIETEKKEPYSMEIYGLELVKTCHYGRAMLLFYSKNSDFCPPADTLEASV